MKKAISLLLALVLCLSLCACGGGNYESKTTIPETKPDTAAIDKVTPETKPDTAAIDKVIDMIDDLEVSLTSGKSISAAEKAYAALTTAQKNAVTNYQNLVEARSSYERILNVFTLIEAIGAVNKSSEPAIIAAENAYKALSIEERIAITNAPVLTAARATFDAIPTEVALTVKNISDYFVLEQSSYTSKTEFGINQITYGIKITGNVIAKQKVTLESMENVTITVRVTCTVGRKDSAGAETRYEDYTYDVNISISAPNGAGSASYSSDYYTSTYYYPTVEVTNIEVIAVTGTVTVD